MTFLQLNLRSSYRLRLANNPRITGSLVAEQTEDTVFSVQGFHKNFSTNADVIGWSMSNQKVAWVHVQYGKVTENYYRRAIRRISEVLRVYPDIVIVDNKSEGHHLDDLHIRGSNRLREFSGWNEGVLTLDSVGNYDWYIFSNDTFGHHRFFWGSLFCNLVTTFKQMRNELRPMIIGDVMPGRMVDDIGEPNLYVSTYLFFINNAAFRLLSFDLIGDAPLRWIETSRELRITAEASPPQVTAFLNGHLCSPGSAGEWRGAQLLDADNLDSIRFKAKAVVLEHWLARRAESLGVRLTPLIDRTSSNFWRWMRAMEVRLGRSLCR